MNDKAPNAKHDQDSPASSPPTSQGPGPRRAAGPITFGRAIAVTAAAMHEFYGAPIEAATACGALLLVVTFLCIIPTGLVFARINHVSLKKAAAEISAGATADDAPGPTISL